MYTNTTITKSDTITISISITSSITISLNWFLMILYAILSFCTIIIIIVFDSIIIINANYS